MDTVYLREFIALAEQGNYHDTAEQLFISQSSLSKHIQFLEKEWCCKFFDRTAKGVLLTAEGRHVLACANRIVQEEDRCRQELDPDRMAGAQYVYIASEYHTLNHFLAGFMEKYKNQYLLNVQMGNSRFAKEALRRNSVELGIAKAYHADDSDLFYIPFGEETLYAVLSQQHPLSKAAMLRLADLEKERFILPSMDSSHTRNCIRACQQSGFTPKFSVYVDRAYNIVELVKAGFGISLLYLEPRRVQNDPQLVCIPITPHNTVRGAMCYRKNGELSAGAMRMLEYAREFPYAY